ncbi:MAG TPA: hypothetical protein VGR32_12780 [Brevundimonas sp.]|uniref:hypothetical protein n=1 Tax=Brevundimonas sp. TaxID=1871086 RepID=UPI002DF2C975|nr:hypothetical protein [Brevundimonas sp.]
MASSLAVSTFALAQERPAQPDPEPTRVDDIVVQGMPLRDQVTTFVDAVTAPPAGRAPARWADRAGVCVGVANLGRDSAQFMVDRVSEVALLLDMPVGEPGCSPNVVVMLTDDAPGLAAALVERSPNAFRPHYAGAAGTVRKLDIFVASDRPARWWHVAMPVTGESGNPAIRMPGDDRIPRVKVPLSRLTTTIRNELRRAFIIVDIDQVEHLTLTQLSDYVAMVAFAQIDPDHEVGDFPSILNVIAVPTAASEMTDWDRAYLQALYGVELNRRRPSSQRGQIAADMFRDRRAAAGDEGAQSVGD